MNAMLPFAHRAPHWAVDGRDWPNREASRFVDAGGLTWHVQQIGAGPPLLLLHGTGASTHSFRDLAPLLAADFQVLLLDLPGHGFTATPSTSGLSLPGMARLVAMLLRKLDFAPTLMAGHSAGAAIAIQMALDGLAEPDAIVSINGALRPIAGAQLFSPLAKLLFINPLVPKLFSWRAGGPGSVRRLLEGTGSQIDPHGVELYTRLFRHSAHVAATLGMMANWDLAGLLARLPSLRTRLVLVTSAGDRAVPPADARIAARLAPRSSLIALPRGGHLIHEEQPGAIAKIICEAAVAPRQTQPPSDGLSNISD